MTYSVFEAVLVENSLPQFLVYIESAPEISFELFDYAEGDATVAADDERALSFFSGKAIIAQEGKGDGEDQQGSSVCHLDAFLTYVSQFPGIKDVDTVIDGLLKPLSLKTTTVAQMRSKSDAVSDIGKIFREFGMCVVERPFPFSEGNGEAPQLTDEGSRSSSSNGSGNPVRFAYQVMKEECYNEAKSLLAEHGEFETDMSIRNSFATRGHHRVDRLLSEGSSAHTVCLKYFDQCGLSHVARELLGVDEGKYTVSPSLIFSLPGAEDQAWHADGPEKNNQLYGFCAFVPLIDLSHEIGFTQFWPRSHGKGLLGCGPLGTYLRVACDAIVKEGEAVLYHYNLMHRGMANNDRLRPIVQFFVYNPDLYKEDTNYSFTVV
tara:strand:+ start:4011 stop:5141 length:1131 start_codon:yes stop_codon:yes gene_type:complete